MSKRKRSGELFDDDDDAVGTLRVNPQFATKFQERKEAEELSRLKDKYGRDALKVHADDGSSSSETEDEDAEADTKARSTEFLRTLSLIKARDKRVFDKNAQFYSPEGDDETPKRGKKAEKPMYLRDHERTRLLSKGAMAFVNDDDDDGDNQQPAPGSYAHEQAAIKASFAHAVSDDDDSDDEESGGFLKLRSKSQHEQDQEDDDYVRWLQGDGAALVADPETAQDLEPLKRFWTDPNLDEGDRFLRDYITRQMWKDEPAGPVTVARLGVRSADVDDDEDVQAVEEMEEYERAYNFRFEEADGTTIKQHPRNVGSSLRQKDTKRKEARQRKAERREEEKARKAEELRRLKNLKQKEMQQKLQQIQEIAGLHGRSLDGLLDVEGDFDPDNFDQQLQSVFDDSYYQDQAGDTEKPVFPDDLGDVGDFAGDDQFDDYGAPQDAQYDDGQYNDGQYDDTQYGDDEFIMDADYVPADDFEVPASAAATKKKKTKMRPATKAEFQSAKQSLEQQLEQFYNLDYEDMAGNVPCRFKYRRVVPNDFGLSAAEILAAEDRELNRWASLKKAVQYRSEEQQMSDKRTYKRRAKKKERVLEAIPSLAALEEALSQEGTKQKKAAKHKKKDKKARTHSEAHNGDAEADAEADVNAEAKNQQQQLAPKPEQRQEQAKGQHENEQESGRKSSKRQRKKAKEGRAERSDAAAPAHGHKVAGSAAAASVIPESRLKAYALVAAGGKKHSRARDVADNGAAVKRKSKKKKKDKQRGDAE
eukprot:m.288116 g.288116  ORF g.288116 m.288116 type:complete len:762 (-) comp19449_c0_seq3:1567-3852(-)